MRRDPLALAAAALALAGVADAAYLVAVHEQGVRLVCSSSGTVDCQAVLHSSYASVGGVPVALAGVVWFAVMALLALWRLASWWALAWIGIGVATVAWLVYVELFRLDKICLWCSVAHLLVLACAALALVAATRPEPLPRTHGRAAPATPHRGPA